MQLPSSSSAPTSCGSVSLHECTRSSTSVSQCRERQVKREAETGMHAAKNDNRELAQQRASCGRHAPTKDRSPRPACATTQPADQERARETYTAVRKYASRTALLTSTKAQTKHTNSNNSSEPLPKVALQVKGALTTVGIRIHTKLKIIRPDIYKSNSL